MIYLVGLFNNIKLQVQFTKNLPFLWQFMDSNLENLVKLFPENKSNYLSQEIYGKQLELINKKEYIHINTWIVLKDLINQIAWLTRLL